MTHDRIGTIEAYLVAAKHAALDREYDRTRVDRVLQCPVCSARAPYAALKRNESLCRFNGGRLERHYCLVCNALFGPAKMLDMTPGELSTEYAILYSSYQEGDTGVDTIRTFRSMEPERGPVYLDWGSGWWSDAVRNLRLEGWNVWGFEPTPGGPKDHIVTDYGHIAPGLAGIYSNNVIEHLQDPVSEFLRMRALLGEGGKMAHSSPCYEERYLDTRFHTVFFLDDSIKVLAERTGFEVVLREKDDEYINTVFRAV